MLVLFETAAGLALFKVLDDSKLKKADDLWSEFETPSKAAKMVALKKFSKYETTAEALEATTALVEGSLSKDLKKFLAKNVVDKESLAVADPRLASVIKDKLDIKCVTDNSVQELMRGIRNQLTSLVEGMAQNDVNTMALGLSHSLSRYKLKFSPDKVDTMIVQAIALLDDMDKELNIYAMRVREWYGWHFPELGRVVTDNLMYARTVKLLGPRTNLATQDLSTILSEELINQIKDVSQISMGTEVSEEDIDHVRDLAEQVINISEYREQLYEYLRNRMQAIAPNLTVMVGELVGARLIAHAGNLMNLAKYPASTIQILGAEKALFRSLKTKNATPKYGLIYHASLVGQSNPKNKGKVSRILAAKTALAVRVDALGETEGASIGLDARARVEMRLQQLEGHPISRSAKSTFGSQQRKYDNTASSSAPGVQRDTTMYDTAADIQLEKPKDKKKSDKKKKEESSDSSDSEDEKKKKKKKEKSKKKSKEASSDDDSDDDKKKKSKKDKKKKSKDSSDESEAEEKPKKKSEKKVKKEKDSSDEDDSKKKKDKKRPREDSDGEQQKKKKKKSEKAKKESSSDSD